MVQLFDIILGQPIVPKYGDHSNPIVQANNVKMAIPNTLIDLGSW